MTESRKRHSSSMRGTGQARKSRTLPANMTPAQRDLFDKIAKGSRSSESAFPLTNADGGLEGPFDAMLLVPGIGDALQCLGAALRFRGGLSDRAREITILLVAHHHGSAFEIYAHEAVGRRIGLTEGDLEDIAQGREPRSADAYESAIAHLATQLLRTGDLDDESYAAAAETLGEAVIFEVTTVVGYYSLLATQLRVFRV
ncbi:carboxymuconolactone decarboxylase family protein [Salinibacterium sp. ZJ450]|uniref:carboxymuconolactone decarboxylase family protein n=1 Tax=Salinibacterium sp. ZJ450 TaxID=2708338 RepID=UPI001CD5A65E|nr:carboxymuconolactone decarboxylase family protein [Salinibacterium sp. ZJ450]